jgi:hypothetical protein
VNTKQAEVLRASKQTLEILEGTSVGNSRRIEELRHLTEILVLAQRDILSRIDAIKDDMEKLKEGK